MKKRLLLLTSLLMPLAFSSCSSEDKLIIDTSSQVSSFIYIDSEDLKDLLNHIKILF